MSHVYAVYVGPTVPFKREEFKTWDDACKFMKCSLDAGIEVHSVAKESFLDALTAEAQANGEYD